MQRRGVRTLLTVLATFLLGSMLSAGQTSPPQAVAEQPRPEQPVSHDIYNPARVALVNAQRQLAESSRQEQDILERIRQMHRELESSLALLSDAASKDPAMEESIGTVRARLAALKDRPGLCPMDNNSSLAEYDLLLKDLQALIEHY